MKKSICRPTPRMQKTIAFVISACEIVLTHPPLPTSRLDASQGCEVSAVTVALFLTESAPHAGLSWLIRCLTLCWWARFTFRFMGAALIWRSGDSTAGDQSGGNWWSSSEKGTASGGLPPRSRWPPTSDGVQDIKSKGHRWMAGVSVYISATVFSWRLTFFWGLHCLLLLILLLLLFVLSWFAFLWPANANISVFILTRCCSNNFLMLLLVE